MVCFIGAAMVETLVYSTCCKCRKGKVVLSVWGLSEFFLSVSVSVGCVISRLVGVVCFFSVAFI